MDGLLELLLFLFEEGQFFLQFLEFHLVFDQCHRPLPCRLDLDFFIVVHLILLLSVHWRLLFLLQWGGCFLGALLRLDLPAEQFEQNVDVFLLLHAFDFIP